MKLMVWNTFSFTACWAMLSSVALRNLCQAGR